jgi:hypothetical protein
MLSLPANSSWSMKLDLDFLLSVLVEVNQADLSNGDDAGEL